MIYIANCILEKQSSCHSCNLESIKLSFQKSAYKLSLNKGFLNSKKYYVQKKFKKTTFLNKYIKIVPGKISKKLPKAKDEKVLGSRGSLSRVKKRQLLNYVLDEDAPPCRERN